MKEPVHNVKRQVKRNLDKSYHWADPFQVYGWLGSGVKDVNGNEIFEGDIILLDGKKFVATIDEGSFIIKNENGEFYYLESLLGEIVGHIAEEDAK